MNNAVFIGVDNGVTGSWAFLSDDGAVLHYAETPIKKCLNYTKAKAYVNRVDTPRLYELLHTVLGHGYSSVHCMIERPMVNPGRFKATVSALRCLEATQIVLENNSLPYEFCDSKQWQKALLPSGLEKEELKFASDEVCKRMFPSVTLKSSGMGDSLLIAEFCRRSRHVG